VGTVIRPSHKVGETEGRVSREREQGGLSFEKANPQRGLWGGGMLGNPMDAGHEEKLPWKAGIAPGESKAPGG